LWQETTVGKLQDFLPFCTAMVTARHLSRNRDNG
jgi:hypothetical protein